MAVSTRPTAGARRTPEEIHADYHRIEAEREAVRRRLTALEGRRLTREEHADALLLASALRTYGRTIDMLIMEAAAPVLWP